VLVLTLLSHGCPTEAIVTAFGLDERTVARWLAEAGRHCQRVHEHLVEQGQVDRRVVRRTQAGIEAVLTATATGTVINTAYIERLNATFRAHLAPLARRGRAIARTEAALTAGLWLVGTAYNFCWPHDSLRLLAGPDAPRKWSQRTPAMAASLADHPWTIGELLRFPIPLPRWVPPKRRGRPPKRQPPEAVA
jgi:hypothetical protein